MNLSQPKLYCSFPQIKKIHAYSASNGQKPPPDFRFYIVSRFQKNLKLKKKYILRHN